MVTPKVQGDRKALGEESMTASGGNFIDSEVKL